MPYSVAMLSIHTSPLDSPGRTKDAGGMNVYIRQLALELGKRNIRVDIFTRWTNEYTPRITQLSSHVRVIHIKAGPVTPMHKNDLYSYVTAFARQIAAFATQESRTYDILHSHYWLSGLAALQLADEWDIPHITMFHTLGRLKQQANPQEHEPQLRLDMEQRLMQHADSIIATTKEERMQLIRACGVPASRIAVIPCGVDTKLFAPHNRQQARAQLDLKQQSPLLLFAGRLDPFKGPDILLRAAAMMEEDAQIMIAGGSIAGDSDVQHLHRLATELGISHRVQFLGARPPQEMPLLYSAANVTVVPSYHESFGMAALESLACGTPVVATKAGGLTTVIQQDETGYLVPRCPGFFAQRLDLLLRDEDTWQRMHRAARPSVLRYSWEHVASQVDAIYNELVQSERLVAAQ